MSTAGSALLIGNFLSGRGASRQVCEELNERLRGAGWTTYTSSGHPSRIPRLLDMLRACRVYGTQIEVAHIDVFSGTAFLWAELCCAVLRRAGCPYVLSLHGGNLPQFSRHWPSRVRSLLNSAAAVTAPSGYLADALRHLRSDIVTLPNAIDAARHNYRVREAAAPSLVWVRAFHRMYNPGLAVRVAAALAPRFPNLRLTMIGVDKDGSLFETRRLAETLGVSDRVALIPGVPKREVPEWLDRNDIFLNTTNIDNTPVSVLEAMASGLCVVSTDPGGVPYIVEDGRNGLLVPVGDEAATVAAVARVLDEPELARTLSANAHLDAQQYDWAPVLAQWQQLLRTIQRRPQ